MPPDTKLRLSLGEPKVAQRKLQVIELSLKEDKNSTCAMVNGISLISPITISSIKGLIQAGISRAIIFMDRNDTASDRLLWSSFGSSLKNTLKSKLI